ncbi:hypothetical protein ACE1OC_19775 [Streptomyces sp. DSM 116496]|uniref:hypothetical protein n=1 Tax=Streptomyces stoeckheimensis TaxID=3344656 RepID=UPI0038B31A03
MGMVTTCLVSLVGVNLAFGLLRLWRRSVEARMVRQVRARPGLDAYHAELLGAAEPLCVRDHQPDRLARNSYRASDVALRLMREDGVLHGGDGGDPGFQAAVRAHLDRAHGPGRQHLAPPRGAGSPRRSQAAGAAPLSRLTSRELLSAPKPAATPRR